MQNAPYAIPRKIELSFGLHSSSIHKIPNLVSGFRPNTSYTLYMCYPDLYCLVYCSSFEAAEIVLNVDFCNMAKMVWSVLHLSSSYGYAIDIVLWIDHGHHLPVFSSSSLTGGLLFWAGESNGGPSYVKKWYKVMAVIPPPRPPAQYTCQRKDGK